MGQQQRTENKNHTRARTKGKIQQEWDKRSEKRKQE